MSHDRSKELNNRLGPDQIDLAGAQFEPRDSLFQGSCRSA